MLDHRTVIAQCHYCLQCGMKIFIYPIPVSFQVFWYIIPSAIIFYPAPISQIKVYLSFALNLLNLHLNLLIFFFFVKLPITMCLNFIHLPFLHNKFCNDLVCIRLDFRVDKEVLALSEYRLQLLQPLYNYNYRTFYCNIAEC